MTMTAEQKLVSKFYETVVNKLKGHLIDIQEGPIVYNFIFEIDKNTKTSKFSVDDEIMMPYSSNRMLITIPKETRNTILLDDLLKTKEFKKFDAILPVILGVDTFGNPFLADLYQMPHVLIGGRTGTGKTVCVKNLLKSLSVKMLPEECKFIIFDMKNEYFKQWNKDKHLFCTVITDIDDCFNQFDLILKMITDRYQILADYKVKNINEYHAKTNKREMPFIVVVIDELCDFVAINKKQTEFESILMEILPQRIRVCLNFKSIIC